MPTVSINVAVSIANDVIPPAAAELGVPAGASQLEQLDAIQTYLRAQLIKLVRKRRIDQGRLQGEQTATNTMPDFTLIT